MLIGLISLALAMLLFMFSKDMSFWFFVSIAWFGSSMHQILTSIF